ncbi:MAG: hypothetical protein ACOYMS_12670 [Terrimicrobiaceae bacterium]
MLLFLALFAAGIFLFWDKIPLTGQVIFGGLILIASLGCIAALCSNKPVIVADEDGLHCHKLVMKKIPWSEIVAVEHGPRSQKMPDGSTEFSLSESWRPLEVYVSNIKKYAGTLPAAALKLQAAPDYQGCVRLRIECTGTTAKSTDLYECILHHIGKRT